MKILLLCLTLALLSACVGKPTRSSQFYVLAVEPAAGAQTGALSQEVSLGIGPVILPELLDRPQIVTRATEHRVDLAEYHRWAGELEAELTRALAQNLMQRLHTDRIRFHPWPSAQAPEYQVTVQFFRFDGAPGTGAVLDGLWRILDGRRECELRVQRFHIEQSPMGEDYAALVGAMSRGVGRLSDEIAAAVREKQPGC